VDHFCGEAGMSSTKRGEIRAGVGGWTYEPWRGLFFPADLPKRAELEYASRVFSSIEVNGTFYRTQTPATYRRWHAETPDDFVFSLKAPRYATHRRVLAEAGPSVKRFLESGLLELKNKLGPINWQFAPTLHYDTNDFEAFLDLLPSEFNGHPLRHAVEVRHETFGCAQFIEQLRRHDVAAVFTDKEGVPNLRDVTAHFVYVRLHRSAQKHPTGYPIAELDAWVERALRWAQGAEPDDITKVLARKPPRASSRDVFCYAIDGYKPHAPAAARTFLERVQGSM
jgi:uncharacterized protein YecE (DUF72 family)